MRQYEAVVVDLCVVVLSEAIPLLPSLPPSPSPPWPPPPCHSRHQHLAHLISIQLRLRL